MYACIPAALSGLACSSNADWTYSTSDDLEGDIDLRERNQRPELESSDYL